jgi:hypothetical protein
MMMMMMTMMCKGVTTVRGLSVLAIWGCVVMAACAGGGGSGSTGSPALQCTVSRGGHGIDTINLDLHCTVSNTAPDETSFQVTYTVVSDQGFKRTYDAPCEGSLRNGSGACDHSYVVVIPFTVASSSAAGMLLPSQRPLGPVTVAVPAP